MEEEPSRKVCTPVCSSLYIAMQPDLWLQRTLTKKQQDNSISVHIPRFKPFFPWNLICGLRAHSCAASPAALAAAPLPRRFPAEEVGLESGLASPAMCGRGGTCKDIQLKRSLKDVQNHELGQ
jgi:hypothetical protein